jgi:UDP-N-acetylmuramoyl-L-alanyl-D-glutamate--2,6-diaminopimelate ligase
MTPVESRHIRFELDRLLAGFADAHSLPPAEIRGLSHDSRRVRPGDLFVALAGHNAHGMSHAEQAVRQGCAAIAFDPSGGGDMLARDVSAVPSVPVESLAQKLGFIADRFYGEPSRHLTAIGITGTNGKTSCSHFLAQALAGERPAAVVGTLGWGEPGALCPTAHTTPDAIEVHDLLFRLHHQGFRAVAMEASSHGLVQGRLNGVRFHGALYTNFSRDHLDYHGTMESYLEAKLRLLDWPGLEFVAFNADDPMAGAVLERMPAGLRGVGFSVAGEKAARGEGRGPRESRPTNHSPLTTRHSSPLVTVSSVHHGPEGVSFRVHCEGRSDRVHAPVFGDFNVENLAAALAVLLAMGWNLAEAAKSLQKVRAVPGRMESFSAAGRTAVVDYAHTPDALASVLRSLRRHCTGRLWVVFGCGGDRDRGKRPEMGAIAEQLADAVVLTDDNPRSEDGDEIIRDIRSGCRREDLAIIRDRRDAIAFALERAAGDDLVLVAGKGHETTQEVQSRKYPFSDREVVRETLERLGAPL